MLGKNSSSTGQVSVKSGATWNNSEDLFVGYNGTGTLLIDAGGTVTTTLGGAYIGYGAGSSGSSATVSGSGASWTNDYFFVGYGASGTLSVSGAALVSSKEATIGSNATGSATVSGTSSTFTSTDVLWVGAMRRER